MSDFDLKDVKKLEDLKDTCKKFFELEKPYGWMIEELTNSLYEKEGEIQGNYLTALGLFCFSEVIGREIMHYKNQKTIRSQFKGKDCFNLFLKEYMGYGSILEKYEHVYEWYRHGLCHEYKIKGPTTTGVFVYYRSEDISAFQGMGVDTTKGILLSEKSTKRMFILLPYLEDFIKGIEKFLKEKSETADQDKTIKWTYTN
ncbi:MAG: hypothetical protein HY001_05315 [Candidatus Portnoybacteria bacterium]|nr:hypothetical protein [Candidatus Portnoybacteria bacterium]